MRLLVLGGTRFVGRALVADAVARGWDVTALHRGVTGAPPEGARSLHADRTHPHQLRPALADERYDAVLLRAGLVLGPHEDVTRLPWWLDRVARGGRVVAPGRPERPLQYVDARDLAAFALTALEQGRSGPYDVVSRPGHTTTRELLEACVAVTGSGAELVWVDEAAIDAAGVEPWTQLPCWVPETGELRGLMESDTSKAYAAGLVCRPVRETVEDTWRWVRAAGVPRGRPGMEPGLPSDAERRLLSLT